MSTLNICFHAHNICFCRKIRKILLRDPFLCRAMKTVIYDTIKLSKNNYSKNKLTVENIKWQQCHGVFNILILAQRTVKEEHFQNNIRHIFSYFSIKTYIMGILIRRTSARPFWYPKHMFLWVARKIIPELLLNSDPTMYILFPLQPTMVRRWSYAIWCLNLLQYLRQTEGVHDNETIYTMKRPIVICWIRPLTEFKAGTSDLKSRALTTKTCKCFNSK